MGSILIHDYKSKADTLKIKVDFREIKGVLSSVTIFCADSLCVEKIWL